ncbi:hypothetical protein BU24DRAFT_121409 [Aaosphaeria arxii CBS 175.79]|uniref:Uncharacterized protein n=1 Tax=Aaosphaeria arxii CBS 175.79 TaxID=1450172 RepID=A0A6A5Y200_9PLEO|nr:uncharacterized protein BU24DRAFT_121409 [Aaosphaeria arxii CBS 175.79]KAF2019522.1 hypothetical protein BU24DRAFT_121409 [Aaosphaeria arxii CBS 175.79]
MTELNDAHACQKWTRLSCIQVHTLFTSFPHSLNRKPVSDGMLYYTPYSISSSNINHFRNLQVKPQPRTSTLITRCDCSVPTIATSSMSILMTTLQNHPICFKVSVTLSFFISSHALY